jgi:hypothetical protein
MLYPSTASPRLVVRAFGGILAASLASGSFLAGADCNHNGVADEEDIASRRSLDCNWNDIPDECDLAVPRAALLLTRRLPALREARSLLVADLDGDGDDDAAVAAGIVWLPVENRDGELARRDHEIVAGNVGQMAAGDADGDGDLDVIYARPEGLTVLQNLGAWVFQSQPILELKVAPGALAAGDLNRDGLLDFAFLGPFELTTVLASTPWAYSVEQRLALDSAPRAVLLTDLDGDGDLDAATANQLENASVALNDGSGRLSRARNYAAGSERRSIAAADFDGDGDVDLATAGSSPGATLLLNRGTGSFLPAVPALADGAGLLAVSGDLNGDGTADLAVHTPVILAAMRGASGGELGAPVLTRVPGRTTGLALIRLREARLPELLTLESATDSLAIYALASSHVSPDSRRDGIPDECQAFPFRRGDATGTGSLDVTDAIVLAGHLFLGTGTPACPEAADFDNNGKLNVTDILGVLALVLNRGAPPAPPGVECGFDPDPTGSPRDLGCNGPQACD